MEEKKGEEIMNKYVYPAVFTAEENGTYSVNFPDLESCYTCGDDLADALKMAEDVLSLTLYEYESQSKTIPAPSAIKSVAVAKNEFVSVVAADTVEYQKRFNKKSIKKTLTIPEWLNDIAISHNVNFSKTLQDALIQSLGIN